MQELDIINDAKNGSEKAFKKLYQKYYQIVKKNVSFNLRFDTNDVVEDLTQEIMSKAFTRIDQYDDTYAFTTWLNRITINHITDYFRRDNKTDIKTDIDFNTLSIYTDKPLDYEIIYAECLSELKEKIKLLPNKEKYILTKYYLENENNDITYEKLANELNMNINNLKSCIFKAKKKLSKLVEN